MKETLTRWICDRCTACHIEPGTTQRLPQSWRYVHISASMSDAQPSSGESRVFCGQCTATALERLYKVGDDGEDEGEIAMGGGAVFSATSGPPAGFGT